MSKTSKHVVPSLGGGWAVRNSGAARVTKTFVTQAEAVKYGRTVAKKHYAELIVHGRDGTIKERNSYGQDPFPPRDLKR